MRPITNSGWGAYEQRRLWLRDQRPLVDGEAMTPFMRVATAADFANPWANSGEGGLAFINADISLYLTRDPVSDWIGFEVSGHVSHAGVAIGHCNLYDTTGPLGTSTVAAVANQRMSVDS
jgi:acyl-CoA thioesterase